MKILIVSPYLPHPLCGHGAGVFIYGMIEHLMYNHQITLLSCCDEREKQLSSDLQKLPIECHFIFRTKGLQLNIFLNLKLTIVRLLQLLRCIILWQPYYVSKFRNRKMKIQLRRLTKDQTYDIVQIEYTQMGQYVKYVDYGKTILHELDVSFRPAYRRYKNSHSLLKKFIAYFEWCQWAVYEPKTVRRFDHVLSVTEQDRMLLEWLTKRKHISYFPHAFEIPAQIHDYNQRNRKSLLFVGTFSHRPNIDAALWLCEEIYPLLIDKYPDTTLDIIGPNPPEQLISTAKRYSGIKVRGFVDNLKPYFYYCGVFVAPLRFGGGIKNKILQAMAYGIPVVTTRFGVEGIDGVGSDDILVGDTPQRIVDHISTLFENPSISVSMSNKGFEIIRKWYSWEKVISKLILTYNNLSSVSSKPKIK